MTNSVTTAESTTELRKIIKDWFRYFISKWVLIFSVALVFAITGFVYAWMQKPEYTAELTFSAENTSSSGLGIYAGLASQFGIDLSSGGGNLSQGDNLIQLLKSRLLVEKTLLSTAPINGKNELLINYYIRTNEIDKEWKKKRATENVVFTAGPMPPHRARDSIMKDLCRNFITRVVIGRLDKNLSLVSIKLSDEDELFAKLFVEQLANTAILYYVDYKTRRSKENVAILQHQTDSIKGLLTGGIVSVAATSDLNVNPIRQVVRANIQRKQVDVQINSQVYGELLKQLEIARISLRKETPLIQFIDRPMLPLDKRKMGRLKGAVVFGFIGFSLALMFFGLKKVLN